VVPGGTSGGVGIWRSEEGRRAEDDIPVPCAWPALQVVSPSGPGSLANGRGLQCSFSL
jgi:hypothetical protein